MPIYGKLNGRPPKFTNPDDLLKKFEEYLAFCEKINEPITITGCVLFLGFCDRKAFYDYAQKEQFSNAIKKIHSYVENSYEKKLHGTGNKGGIIFALKNLRWQDKTEIEHSIPDGGNFSISFRDGDKTN